VDEPQTLYDRPVNLFVGGFIGSPAMNMIEATLDRRNGGYAVTAGSSTLALDDEALAAHPGLADYAGRDVIVGIRPEDLEEAALAPDTPEDRRLHGKVSLREALGSEIIVHFDIDAKAAMTEDVRELAQDTDAVAVSEATKEKAHTTMTGRFGARSRVQEGEVAEVAVDTRSLHFFDPETGLGIYDQATAKKGDSA
jgi:multiple sugar transport system ATP-binding protein